MSKKPENKASLLRWRGERNLRNLKAISDEVEILEKPYFFGAIDDPTDKSRKLKSRPPTAQEWALQPRNTTRPPTNSTPAGANVGCGKKSEQAVTADNAENKGDTTTHIPDNWDDEEDEEASKLFATIVKKESAVTNVGCGGYFRRCADIVHHLNPVLIPSDAVKDVFEEKPVLPTGHTTCQHRLQDCTCVRPQTLVFRHSSYYIGKQEMSCVQSRTKMYLLFRYASGKRHKLSYVDGKCKNTDVKLGVCTYVHDDHRWQLEPTELPDGRTYCPRVILKNRSMAVVKATVVDLRVAEPQPVAEAKTTSVTVEAPIEKAPDKGKTVDKEELRLAADLIVGAVDPKSAVDSYTLLSRCVTALMRRVKGLSHTQALRAVQEAMTRVRGGHLALAQVAHSDRINRYLLGYTDKHGLGEYVPSSWIWFLIALVTIAVVASVGIGNVAKAVKQQAQWWANYEQNCGDIENNPWDFSESHVQGCSEAREFLWPMDQVETTMDLLHDMWYVVVVIRMVGLVAFGCLTYLMYGNVRLWLNVRNLQKRREAIRLDLEK